jgi:hypothetical protein
MKLVAVAMVAVVLAGCAQTARVPVDVSLIPNDCANRARITAWLTQLSNQPRAANERIEDYENAKSQIKARIWNIRYHCQPVN